MSEEISPAKTVVVAKLRQLGVDYQESLGRMAKINEMLASEQAIQQQLQALAADCYAAARVIGFDLDAAIREPLVPDNTHSSVQREPPPAQIPPVPPTAAKSIREEILDHAKRAFPNPVKATPLRLELEKTRGPLHEKTVGMTLYRLSKEGAMRREGRNWFFVPEDQRTKNPGTVVPGSIEDLLG